MKYAAFLFSIILALLAGCAGAQQTPTPQADAPGNGHGHAADATSPAERAAAHAPRGYLVVAPDRGYLGNEEIRDAFAALDAALNADQPARLVFVTDDRTQGRFDAALASLREDGAQDVAVLPLFLTTEAPRFERLRSLITARADQTLEVTMGAHFGQSYLAVELLSDHLRHVAEPQGRRVVVLGYGATNADEAAAMTAELERAAAHAGAGFGFEAVRVVVWPDRKAGDAAAQSARAALQEAVAGGERPVVVPFHLGHKYDGMMTVNNGLRRLLPEGVELLDVDLTPHPVVATWMVREANRQTHLGPDDLGVVILAHGADFDWNETMRQAVEPLQERYKIEFAFSMADKPVVERAIRRLEARGARKIVVVRVFGLASSFRGSVERMIGADVEPHLVNGAAHDGSAGAHGHGQQRPGRPAAAAHGHGHGHGAMTSGPPTRIRSAAVITTVGGLEDHRLFARALVARAREISKEPARETIILVSHGVYDDRQDTHWMKLLESLAEQMRAEGADEFRAIRMGTWREDWPDKRKASVDRIRSLVEEANRDGRALVIPARTNARGPEAELLEGLDFAYGYGFAPHPLFADWIETQIQAGLNQLHGQH